MVDDRVDALERRITRLEDEREIRYLIGRYGHYADLGFEDAWADQWTDDGVYDIVTVQRDGAGYDGAVRFAGKRELYVMLRDPNAHKLFEGRSLHLQDLNLVIQVNGDEAVAHSYSITMLRDGDSVAIRTAGMVRWQFKRTDGRWLISNKDRRNVGDGTAFADIVDIPARRAARSMG